MRPDSEEEMLDLLGKYGQIKTTNQLGGYFFSFMRHNGDTMPFACGRATTLLGSLIPIYENILTNMLDETDTDET